MMQRGIKRPRSEAAAAPDAKQPTPSETTTAAAGNTTTGTLIASASATAPGRPSVLRLHRKKSSHGKIESLATEEGAQMSQIMNTWTVQEQDRFAAYRRCVLKGDVISKFVAFSLAKEEQKRFSLRANASSILFGAVQNRETKMKIHASPLSQFVSPNCSSEITVVVSTLAKAYAQRLVSAARQVANASGYSTHQRLLPQHYLEAYQRRVQAGLDPGFFLSPQQRTVPTSTQPNRTTGLLDKYQFKLAAAKAAQDAYDEAMKVNQNNNENKKDSNTKMN
mmetsp:Transcript_10927/g.15730  ORF Transcript_10927/g.15730 Transcript_10927/m.15730 type:complete len:279 (-) Transcript_10927:119-955(-)